MSGNKFSIDLSEFSKKQYITVNDLVKELSLKTICSTDSNLKNEVKDCYIGDLLSFVISKAKPCCVWLTVMGNTNAIAVASMIDASCIILTDNSHIDEDAEDKAKINNIAVFSTELSSFEVAKRISILV